MEIIAGSVEFGLSFSAAWPYYFAVSLLISFIPTAILYFGTRKRLAVARKRRKLVASPKQVFWSVYLIIDLFILFLMTRYF